MNRLSSLGWAETLVAGVVLAVLLGALAALFGFDGALVFGVVILVTALVVVLRIIGARGAR